MASTGLTTAVVPDIAKAVWNSVVKRNGNRVTGVVISAGLAQKTVKVRVGGEEWNKKVQKVRHDTTSLAARPGPLHCWRTSSVYLAAG